MLLVDTLHKGQSVSTQVQSASTVRSETERFNTQVWSPSSKSLNQLSDAAHKTHPRWVADCPLSYLHQEIEDIIVLKNNKGTEDNRAENSTTPSKSPNSSTNDSSRTERSHCSPLTMFQVFLMLSVLIDLMISIQVMNLMDLFQGRLSAKNLFCPSERTCRDWSFVSHEHRPLQLSLSFKIRFT